MKEKKDPLNYHRFPQPGKVGTSLIRHLHDPSDLALAYSPGVAEACKAIAADPMQAMNLTCRQSLVAVISNGTAVLGLGDLGPLASTPVMEGKAMLFMQYGKLNAINLQINEKDPHKLAAIIASLAPSFGGINLEDIKAPECFVVEDLLKKLLAKQSVSEKNQASGCGNDVSTVSCENFEKNLLKDCLSIPVFHDDQHGTAITVAAALTNALFLVGKSLNSIRCVVSGAGASALSTLRLLHLLGLPPENVCVFDSQGLIHRGRSGLSAGKQIYANSSEVKDLPKALVEADVFLGMSKGNVLKPDWLLSMKPHPIIFALANPEPEIHPHDIYSVRPDAIVSTGRSDYPNQVNNLLCFPYIFRAALDSCSYTINDDMMLACSKAIGSLAQKGFSDIEGHKNVVPFKNFGQDFFIPFPFDVRLLETVPLAVAEAAVRTGVADPSFCLKRYGKQLVDLAYESFPMVGALKKKKCSWKESDLHHSSSQEDYTNEKSSGEKLKKIFWVMGSCPAKNLAFMTASLFLHREKLASITWVTSKCFEDSKLFQAQGHKVFWEVDCIASEEFSPSREDLVMWPDAIMPKNADNAFYIQQKILELSTAATIPKVVLWDVWGALPDHMDSLQSLIQFMEYRHVYILADFLPCSKEMPFEIVPSIPMVSSGNTLYLRFFKEKFVSLGKEVSIPMKKMEPFMVTPGCHWQGVLAPSVSDIIEKSAFSLLSAYRD